MAVPLMLGVVDIVYSDLPAGRFDPFMVGQLVDHIFQRFQSTRTTCLAFATAFGHGDIDANFDSLSKTRKTPEDRRRNEASVQTFPFAQRLGYGVVIFALTEQDDFRPVERGVLSRFTGHVGNVIDSVRAAVRQFDREADIGAFVSIEADGDFVDDATLARPIAYPFARHGET